MKILTLNTWQEMGPWQKRWEVIFSAIENLKPDVIGFQEVFNPDWAQTIVKRTGYSHFVFAKEHSGLMILSRYPVETWACLTMKTQSPTENYFRYALFAQLKTPQGNLSIFNTHLSWQLDETEVRIKQVGELLAFVKEKTQIQDKDVLFMGDFNSPSGTREIRKVTEEAGFIDVFAKVHPGKSGLTWDNANPYTMSASHPISDRRIDYVFVSSNSWMAKGSVKAQVVLNQPSPEGIYGSDHYGVLVEFES